jgi:hypothetical protein
MEVCREWAIEVDEDRQRPNLQAQEEFIVSFVGSLYDGIDSGHQVLSKVSSLHYTRIYNPERDKKGAYVRLRVFADQQDLQSIENEIDIRLEPLKEERLAFQVDKRTIEWNDIGEEYGGASLSRLFRDYLHSTSKISYELLRKKPEGIDVDRVLWRWTHFFFNATRGYSRSIIEVAQGAVTGFISNV